jgi:hypothetical protein
MLERFKDANGNPIKRYECKITHLNNGKEQLWDRSKTVCLQIVEQLRKGFTTLKVTRNGSDRRYAGRIADWEQAHYPLEGNFVS